VDFVQLTSAVVQVSGFPVETLDVPPGVFFAIGTGGFTGLAAFGDTENGATVATIIMRSPGFGGYDAVSKLAPVPLTMLTFKDGYPASVNGVSGDLIQLQSVSRSAFSASVPEPATWAMLVFGFGALGWRARSRRSHAGA
jgi:hypothetical protein